MIDKIKEKVDSGELFRANFKTTPVDYEMNQLKSINMEDSQGWALRVINDGRIGFSSSTSQEQIDGMIKKALEVAQFGQAAKFSFPNKIARNNEKEINLYDESIKEKTIEEMIETGNELVKQVLSYNSDFRCDADITKQEVNLIVDHIREKFPQFEIEIHEGGQPHYQFIIAIE